MRSILQRGLRRIRRNAAAINLYITKRFYQLPILELNVNGEAGLLHPPILEDICIPPYHGPTDHDDFTPLMYLATLLRPRTIVELGTAHGNTVANICRQCPEATVFTVNALAEQQTGTTGTYVLTRDEIGRVYRAYGYQSRVVQIFQNTLDLDLAAHFDGPTVDLAIIDACHDTDYVVNDFLKVQPYIRPNGVVLFHDTHPTMKQHLAGSYIACMILRRKRYDVRYIKNTWWAVWINGEHLAKDGRSSNMVDLSRIVKKDGVEVL